MTSCSKQEIMMATSAPAAPSADEPCSNKRARISLDNDEKEQQEDTSSSAPDMSLLPPGSTISPTWTKSDWLAWDITESAYRTAMINDRYRDNDVDDNKYYDYLDQREAAINWTEPNEVTLRICLRRCGEQHQARGEEGESTATAAATTTPLTEEVLSTVRLSRSEPKTFRAIIEDACATHNFERDAYYWTFDIHTTHPDNDVLAKEDDEYSFTHLWTPTFAICWEDETTYIKRLIASPKPCPPTQLTCCPSFDKLKSPPPEGSATADEWKRWHKENNLGTAEFWYQKNTAVTYRCPNVIPLRLKGVTHSIDIDAEADSALSEAVAAFATAAGASATACAVAANGEEGVVSAPSVAASEYLVKDGSGNILDQYTTTPRSLYYGTRKEPRTLNIVYRDPAQTKAALEAKHGGVPVGYVQFRGLGYLVEDTEAPWLISTEYGVEAFNQAVRSLMVYAGCDYGARGDNGLPSYDPIVMWWEMCKLLKKDILNVSRKPKGHEWDCENIERALDKFAGIMLVTVINDEWQRDARGKIMGWDPECRKETISIMKKMDDAAVKLISAAKEVTVVVPNNGMLGLTRTLEQTKRLLTKLQQEYDGFSTPGYDHHKGYLAFSKALRLFNTD